MLLSKNWLQDFIKIPNSISAEQIAFDLTMKTVEVENVKKLGENLENIVVGKIVSIDKHPNADSLVVCKVDVGEKEDLQIVCGGTNLNVGMKVALGKLGAMVRWHGEGDLIELKDAKIRGVESFGMICAADEIGLGDMFPKKSEKEILDLSELKAKAGTPLDKALDLNDVVYDIDNKSMTHRSDLWGHYGMARELSAFYDLDLETFNPLKIKKGTEVNFSVDVQDTQLCPRYIGLIMHDVKISASPDWMQKRLASIGVRPINNIVDITNYVMFELGQPMHAFDAKLLKSAKIVVRRAKDGEKIKTLDNKEYKLTKEMLVIADDEKAIALAGIMGSENSEIKDHTTEVVFEAANFKAENIRKTTVALGLRTDSSARFEKTLDPELAELAMRRVVELVMQVCPSASVVSDIVDEINFKKVKKVINIDEDFVSKKIGLNILKKDIVNILSRLGFEVDVKNKKMSVTVPSWRAVKDVSIAEDLVEEVARLYGYDNIQSSLPSFSIAPPKQNKLHKIEMEIKESLSRDFGFCETCNYSFIAPELLHKTNEDVGQYVELSNPIAKDRPFLRRNIFGGLLENIEHNAHRFEKIKIFEIGKTYHADKKGEPVSPDSKQFLPKQDVVLGMAFAQKDVDVPFYQACESTCVALKKSGFSVTLKKAVPSNKELWHEGRFAEVYLFEKNIGFVGELHPFAQERFGIPYRTAVVEICLNELLSAIVEDVVYEPIAEYPSINRDIAFTVNRSVEHIDIVNEIKSLDSLIASVEIFDAYVGKQVAEGKKSVAYHIVFRSNERTLETKEVDSVHEKIVQKLKNKFDAEVRK